MQKLAPGFSERNFWSESPNKRERSSLAVLHFEKSFERDVFRFNPFNTFRQTTSCVFIGMQLRHGSCERIMQRNEKTHFRSRLKINS